ncbi:hypothetical protein [Caballeronia sp. J97]|uniref:hypothetical protein n=1 Tax=Caballeronia sp. J97 TaxID=2805429 RepID=UPI002AB299C0|nr:hypothetical protein [Caballeronia sp. J97]
MSTLESCVEAFFARGFQRGIDRCRTKRAKTSGRADAFPAWWTVFTGEARHADHL